MDVWDVCFSHSRTVGGKSMYGNRQSFSLFCVEEPIALWRCGGVEVWRCGGVSGWLFL